MFDYDLLIIGAGPAGIFTALEMNRLMPEKRVLVVDDLLATGGTICTACKLIEKIGGIVAGTAFLIELDNLKGKTHLPKSAKNIELAHY